ncbi:hypothetical protein [Pseudarthrobacter enclensis]|uniref:hypothetical protein n=1 Tax=Pseudarthrobacter enclensis TaxID=993070 RepID=UPI0011462E48|nr:hypothetical protein [Pseudarthrobacter enclensis]
MIESAAFVIRAAGHAVDFVVEPFPPADPIASLQAAMRGEGSEPLRVPLVYTGVHTGPVELAIEVLQERPDAASPIWEDVHEVSLTLPEGRTYFNTPTEWEMKDVGNLVGDEKGSYRARIQAVGRDAASDLVVYAPTERHLIQLWKESASPPRVISTKSVHGKSILKLIRLWQATGTATAQTEPAPIDAHR